MLIRDLDRGFSVLEHPRGFVQVLPRRAGPCGGMSVPPSLGPLAARRSRSVMGEHSRRPRVGAEALAPVHDRLRTSRWRNPLSRLASVMFILSAVWLAAPSLAFEGHRDGACKADVEKF